MAKSMFTDNDFETMRGFVESANPVLLASKETMREKIKELDTMRSEFTASQNLDMENATAIHILLQGSNFLLRCLGESEVPIPDEIVKIIKGEEPEQEITKKHVALFVEKALVQAISQVYGSYKDLHYKVYSELKSLVEVVATGKVCGVVSVCSSSRRIENSIRHDLKHLSGWNAERASTVALPPCFDVHILQVMNGVVVIRQMEKGKYKKPEATEKFSLVECLPNLAARMKVPKSPIQVCVIDDEPKVIEGMIMILNAWPGIILKKIVQSDGREPVLGSFGDIFLLDEAMGEISGSEIARSIMRRSSRTIVASTTSGGTPDFAKWHFASKGSILVDYESAISFVEFINKLISAREASL